MAGERELLDGYLSTNARSHRWNGEVRFQTNFGRPVTISESTWDSCNCIGFVWCGERSSLFCESITFSFFLEAGCISISIYLILKSEVILLFVFFLFSQVSSRPLRLVSNLDSRPVYILNSSHSVMIQSSTSRHIRFRYNARPHLLVILFKQMSFFEHLDPCTSGKYFID